jgi:hypothetical protein
MREIAGLVFLAGLVVYIVAFFVAARDAKAPAAAVPAAA